MKHIYDIKQVGYNPDYPMEADIWTLSQPVPEWISDRAKISEVNESGEPIVLTRKKSSGGLDIFDSSGREVLVSLDTEDSYILYSKTHPLISLTPHQLDLLYVRTNIRN